MVQELTVKSLSNNSKKNLQRPVKSCDANDKVIIFTEHPASAHPEKKQRVQHTDDDDVFGDSRGTRSNLKTTEEGFKMYYLEDLLPKDGEGGGAWGRLF